MSMLITLLTAVAFLAVAILMWKTGEFGFYLPVLTIILLFSGLVQFQNHAIDKRIEIISTAKKHRMEYHAQLKNKSVNIQNQYVKERINEILNTVDRQYENDMVEITVPDDFFAFSRQSEYNQIVGLLKNSGFSSIKNIKQKCHFLGVFMCEEYSAIKIY